MNPLRILIVTNRIPYPLRDGGALAMDAIIRGYQRAGMEVHLLAMNTSRHPVGEDLLKTLYPEIHGFDTVPVNNDVKTLSVLKNFIFSQLPEHVQRFYHPVFVAKLKSLLSTFKPDVVQMESPFLSAYVPLIKNAVHVMRVHNVEYEIWQRLAGESSGIKRIYLSTLASRMRHYEEKIWEEYDLLLPITETDAAVIHKAHPNQEMLVSPYGIETTEHSEIKETRFFKAYHLGAMDWLPNQAAIDWFLKDIWPVIKARVPEAEFYFGGRNVPERFFDHLPEGTFCCGEIMDVQDFYSDKQILVVPLLAGGGIRVKILEAMAEGKLVISTAIGMQGINAMAGIHYLEANTPEEFANAFQLAIDDATNANKISSNAQTLVLEHYANKAIISRIINRLNAIVKQKTSG